MGEGRGDIEERREVVCLSVWKVVFYPCSAHFLLLVLGCVWSETLGRCVCVVLISFRFVLFWGEGGGGKGGRGDGDLQ